MPTLYVEDVPKPLYEALRARAKQSGTSISAVVREVLGKHVITAAERRRRQKAWDELMKIRAQVVPGDEPYQTAEEMVRESREEWARKGGH